MENCEFTTWEEYANGVPENNELIIGLIISTIVSLKEGNLPKEFLCQDDDENFQANDESEIPDTGPWLDAPNYKAKIRAIRTGANGAYRWTTLEALTDIPKVMKKGSIFTLSNKNWEKEFKRAQNGGFNICLRISDKAVQGIEVLS